MELKELLKTKVIHKKFGVGEVIKVEGMHLYVQFTKVPDIKKFLYPDAFDGFLTIENTERLKQVSMDLIGKRNEEAEMEHERNERYAKMDEELREMHKEAIKRRIKAAAAKQK